MEEHLAPVDDLPMLRTQNSTIYICLFLFALLTQQATYIVSALFVGQISTEYVFGNTAQLTFNAIFVALALFGILHLGRYLFEKFSGRSARDIILISGLFLAIPIIIFVLAVRPASTPYNLNYRGCAVRISGELTSCGFWSATSDLFAMLLISIVVLMVFQGIKPREN